MQDIGLLDHVVACTKYCLDVCPAAGDGSRLIISDSWTAHADEIGAAKPDLVIASVPYQIESVREILQAGVRFLGLAPRTLDDIYTDIVAISSIMGFRERGEKVANTMKESFQRVCDACGGNKTGLRVFSEEWGKPIIASQHWVAELVEFAGGTFVGEPGQKISAETIKQVDPDVLTAAWCGAGDRVPLEKIVEQRNWSTLRAVRDGRLFCINDELLNTPASNLVAGLQAIAWALHPHLFPKPPGIRQFRPSPNLKVTQN